MATTSLPRTSNRSAVLAALLSGTEMDRQQLISDTGLSRATVFRIVDDLMAESLVREGARVLRDGPGRQSTSVAFDDRSALVCGIDLGGTNCRVVVADALGRAVIRSRDATPRDAGADELAAWVAGRVADLVARYGDGVPLTTVTIGLPGVVTGDGRSVVASHNLGQITGTRFIEAVSARFGVPTVVGNDSNLALLGELQYGSLPERETAVLLAMGTGLGSAVSLDGRVLVGRTGLLGEFGRLPLPGRDQRLRDLLSGADLVAYARGRGADVPTAQALFAEPEKHADLLAEVHGALTHLVTVVALAYEPGTVVLTGGFSESFGAARLAEISDRVAEAVGVRSVVRRADLGDSAGLLGSMASSLGRYYESLGVSTAHAASVAVDRDLVVGRLDACPTAPGAAGHDATTRTTHDDQMAEG
ncbi:ROK family transcriptional regulator [Streptomyces fuscigenes]|uniref:ROK family transcriptional regulator n=1 Tax=Streptomyces fuscigenes TaxID=1528880 RepID=UPI001F1BDE93|nr:ROK family protein [Streptomyces fuscigenes]MCF3963888.1 ROK family protein [Streptomyces fuscigenes]